MSLDTLERRKTSEHGSSGRLRTDRRDRRWRATARLDRRDRPSRALLIALVLACATLITLDQQGGDNSPLEPARQAVGELFGPVETATSATVRPFVAVPDWFRTHDSLRGEINQLEAENARLRAESETSGYDRNRLEEYDGLTRAAGDLGYALVPARVVGIGPAQSFSQTVTIDAGRAPAYTPT
jgi:rod shape-determining protein MreC